MNRQKPGVARFARRALGVLLGVAALSAALPAQAGWREDLGTFRIGMLAEPGAGQGITGLAEIKRAYTMALGMPVEILVARDYAALIEAQAAGKLGYAVYSATAYATASRLCTCVEPFVAPVAADGATGLRAVLVTRDNRLTAVEDIARRRVAIVEGDNIAGFALPASALGDVLDKEGTILVKVDTASAAEALLVDGSVDAIFGWVPSSSDAESAPAGGTLERLVAAGIDPAALQVVWTSDLLRFGPHALRSDVDPEARRSLTILLTAMLSQTPELYDLIERHHDGGFKPVTAEDYATALALVDRLAAAGKPQ